MDEKILSRNIKIKKWIMVFLACFFTLFAFVYGVLYFKNLENTSDETKEEVKTCEEGYLKYYIDNSFDIVKEVKIGKDSATLFYDSFNFDEMIKVEDVSDNYDYLLSMCDLSIYFGQEDNYVLYNDEYYMLGKNEDKTIEYFNEQSSNFDDLYFFDLSNNKEISFDSGDIMMIKNIIEDKKYDIYEIELAIFPKYLLVIGSERIYLEDIDDYAMYGSSIVKFDDELFSIISKYLKNEGGCCSCCPDLKPGESCIALCCPCSGSE
ncbi:MAG: hypothetical protein ACI4XM_08825 [Candidatus Coprovivens sp.]